MRRFAKALVLASTGLSGIAAAQALPAQEPAPTAVILPTPVRDASGALLLSRDTMIRLMVTKEVNSRDARKGDKFTLRVDEDVVVDGVTLVPIGAKATAEIVDVKENGAVGKSGRLGARLLYVEVGSDRIPISGEEQVKGPGSSNRVIMSVVGFGVLGLLTKGNSARFKAGDILNGYVAEDMKFDPATGAFASHDSSSPGPLIQ